MSDKVEHIIRNLLSDITRFNSNDVLVNIRRESRSVFETHGESVIPVGSFPAGILKEFKSNLKESGLNSLCYTTVQVLLKKDAEEIKTPVLLIPANLKIDKVKDVVKINLLEEDVFINPYLLHYLDHILDVDPEKIKSLTSSNIGDYLTEVGLTLETNAFLGNFHHHRYQSIREMEELLSSKEFSPSLLSLLGFGEEQTPFELGLPPDNLYPADTDHEKVFEIAAYNDTLIQGPPGTGKSQVLTNLIGKFLAANYNAIIVSEKRVALEVIRKKLGTFGLDRLCFIATADRMSAELLKGAKKNWEFFENYTYQEEINLRVSEQEIRHLQFTLDLLSNDTLFGGISLYQFEKLCGGRSFKDVVYNPGIIDLSKFLENSALIHSIYEQGINRSVGLLSGESLKKEKFESILERIPSWIELITLLERNYKCTTWFDLDKAMKYAIDCQIFENEYYRKYRDLFIIDSKPYRKFLQLRKKLIKLKEELPINDIWVSKPGKAETIGLINSLNGKGNFIDRIKAKRRWRHLSNIPFSGAETALKEHLVYLDVEASISQIKVDFYDLGIDDIENDLDIIYQTIHHFSKEKWDELHSIPEEERKVFTDHHALLLNLKKELGNNFSFNPQQNVKEGLTDIQKNATLILPHLEALSKLDKNLRSAFREHASFESLEEQILYSHRIRFNQQFPALSTFKISELRAMTDNVIHSEKKEARLFALQILHASVNRFKSYSKILNTPARKLSEEQKTFKADLRKGKSILVKEFGKSRSHMSIRELYLSEARLWLEVLKPIWLSNPAQVANSFPLETGMFDVAIFDEASQLVLQDALGTIQRSTRVVVAGDEWQMGPSSYFKNATTDPVDLLHQANFYWQKVPLLHHYRSANPSLIRFSNEHFYEGKLQAFPAYESGYGIRRHLVSNGIYIDRKNDEEAKATANHVKEMLKESEHVGIVAFSEEQLQNIWAKLDSETQNKLNTLIDEDKSFFKTLENVQGDECDHLIISFGYGYNEIGEFHMRFGPMNTENGRKRLNVLLTRAVYSIDFFCSVTQRDFKISDNESVELLRKWFQFLENIQPETARDLPYDLSARFNKNEITIPEVHLRIKNARELVTLQQVLVNRGWRVNYC